MQFAVRLMSCVIVSFLGIGVKFYKSRVGIYMDVIEGTALPWVGVGVGVGVRTGLTRVNYVMLQKNSPALPYHRKKIAPLGISLLAFRNL